MWALQGCWRLLLIISPTPGTFRQALLAHHQQHEGQHTTKHVALVQVGGVSNVGGQGLLGFTLIDIIPLVPCR
jgi:hypothetical protein